MKRLILLPLLLAAFCAAAQTVELHQTVNGSVNELIIDSGWDVQLVQHDADSTFVVIHTTSDQAEALQQNPVITVKRRSMTLRKCPAQFRGTRVEIHSNFDMSDIVVFESDIHADRLILHRGTSTCSIYLMEGARFSCGTLGCISKAVIDIDQSALTADTLMGGTFDMNIDNGSSFKANVYHQKQLNVELYDGASDRNFAFPDTTLVINSTDPVNHITLCDPKHSFTLTAHLDFGIRSHGFLGRNTDEGFLQPQFETPPVESPYFSMYDINLSLPILAEFKLAPRFSFFTGIEYVMNIAWLWNPSKLDESGHLQPDNSTTATRSNNFATLHYLGVPVKVQWKPTETSLTSFSADLFFGHTIARQFATITPQAGTNKLLSVYGKPQYQNPWKLEAAIGWITHDAGLFKGFRFYANLLPEFRNSPDLPKAHSCGIEILF